MFDKNNKRIIEGSFIKVTLFDRDGEPIKLDPLAYEEKEVIRQDGRLGIVWGNREEFTPLDAFCNHEFEVVKEIPKTLKMTHNEYDEFLKNNAERRYTDPNYSMDDYYRDAASVEIVGFDLERFALSDEAKAVINKLFSTERVNRLGHTLLQCHFDNSHAYAVANSLGCELVCDKCYNGFFKNDESRCLFEFCEGDFNVVLCETEAAYREELEDYCTFYEVDVSKAMPEMSLGLLAERLVLFYKDYDYYDYQDSLETGATDVDAITRMENDLVEGKAIDSLIEQLTEISNDEDLSKEQITEVNLMIRDLKRKFVDKPSIDEVIGAAEVNRASGQTYNKDNREMSER